MTNATYKGWTREQAAKAISNPKLGYGDCMSKFGYDCDGNYSPANAESDFQDAVDILEMEGISLPKSAATQETSTAYELSTSKTTAMKTLIEQRTALVNQVQQLQQQIAAIDEQILSAVATKVEPTKVEPAPEPAKAKSVPQQKAEENARIALANKGKSAKEKAEALDVPLSTVKKVEKAKAQPKEKQELKAADLRKLAKELKVDATKVDFRSKTQRQALQAQLEQKQAESKVWQGLSASRQAELNKLARTNAN